MVLLSEPEELSAGQSPARSPDGDAAAHQRITSYVPSHAEAQPPRVSLQKQNQRGDWTTGTDTG